MKPYVSLYSLTDKNITVRPFGHEIYIFYLRDRNQLYVCNVAAKNELYTEKIIKFD